MGILICISITYIAIIYMNTFFHDTITIIVRLVTT